MTKQPLPLAVEHWKAKCEAAERRCEQLARVAGERGERIRVLRALLEAVCDGEVAGETEPDDAGADSWT